MLRRKREVWEEASTNHTGHRSATGTDDYGTSDSGLITASWVCGLLRLGSFSPGAGVVTPGLVLCDHRAPVRDP